MLSSFGETSRSLYIGTGSRPYDKYVRTFDEWVLLLGFMPAVQGHAGAYKDEQGNELCSA